MYSHVPVPTTHTTSVWLCSCTGYYKFSGVTDRNFRGNTTVTYCETKTVYLSYSIKSKWYFHRFDVVSMCTPPLLLAIAAYRYNNTGVKPFARVKLPRSCIGLWFHKGLDKTIQEVSAMRQLQDIDNHTLELCITESEWCILKTLCAWTASYHHLEIPLRV